MTKDVSNINDVVSELSNEIDLLERKLKTSKAKQVKNGLAQKKAEEVSLLYFNKIKKQLLQHYTDLSTLDEIFEQILRASRKQSLRVAYLRLTGRAKEELGEILIKAIVLPNTEENSDSSKNLSGDSVVIAETLSTIEPKLALSYKQACVDLMDTSRLSHRGTAAELREVLREVLDYLAPDTDVVEQKNFKYEKDENGKERTKPTMSQKVKFILSSRKLNRDTIKSSTYTTSIIDTNIASLARSTYTRGSIATHTAAERTEVVKIFRYTNAVLCELLEIDFS